MVGGIIYKEWLKSYKIIALFAVIIGWSLFDTFIDAKNNMEFINSTSAILSITQMGRFEFNLMNYILMVFGISLGIAQYYPEVSSARIRLFLHLPMKHVQLITILFSSGLILLILSFFIITLFYSLILNSYYPKEVFQGIFTKLFPMYLGSILCYLATMIAFLEPKIIKKVLYILIAFYFLMVYLPKATGGYFMGEVINISAITVIIIYILTSYEVFRSYTKGYIK
ncbi:MAG: hypothetical protein OIF32_08050 [Campylobacterales bacterium]|nr:hypothetical protein [Campylobacterales bacterium]